MQVFGAMLSPFVRKVHIVAAEKGLSVETIPVNSAEPSAAFLAASPFRKIPALRDGDFTVADSTAIVTYLEAKYPEPALLPALPELRAKAVWFEEFADTILAPVAGKIAFNRFIMPRMRGAPGDEGVAAQAENELAPILDYLDTQAPVSGGWLAGEDYTVGDIAVASVLMLLRYTSWSIDQARHPAIWAWYNRVTGRPAWSTVAVREKEMVGAMLKPA